MFKRCFNKTKYHNKKLFETKYNKTLILFLMQLFYFFFFCNLSFILKYVNYEHVIEIMHDGFMGSMSGSFENRIILINYKFTTSNKNLFVKREF